MIFSSPLVIAKYTFSAAHRWLICDISGIISTGVSTYGMIMVYRKELENDPC